MNIKKQSALHKRKTGVTVRDTVGAPPKLPPDLLKELVEYVDAVKVTCMLSRVFIYAVSCVVYMCCLVRYVYVLSRVQICRCLQPRVFCEKTYNTSPC